jgi:hypothetical protein
MLTGYRSLTISFVEFDVTSATALGGIAGCLGCGARSQTFKKIYFFLTAKAHRTAAIEWRYVGNISS